VRPAPARVTAESRASRARSTARAWSIDTEVEFVSDTGPFGTIQVIIEGTFPGAADGPVNGTMTLQGGNIPNGPITYTFASQ
jgi:hypothetical protein